MKNYEPLIIEELYTALIEAGASDDTAKSAARAVAAYENQLTDLRSDIKIVKWISIANLTIVIAIAIKLFLLGGTA